MPFLHNPSALLGEFTGAVTGPAEGVIEFMFGPAQHDEHTRGWRWHLYMQDQRRRLAAMQVEARAIIARRNVANA
jgi:hypothetical protein